MHQKNLAVIYHRKLNNLPSYPTNLFGNNHEIHSQSQDFLS